MLHINGQLYPISKDIRRMVIQRHSNWYRCNWAGITQSKSLKDSWIWLRDREDTFNRVIAEVKASGGEVLGVNVVDFTLLVRSERVALQWVKAHNAELLVMLG